MIQHDQTHERSTSGQARGATVAALAALRQTNAIKLAWSLVDADELASALRRMPARSRNQMLSALRVPTAKVTTNTARLLLTSLTHRSGERQRAGRFITRHFAHQVTDRIDESLASGVDLDETLLAEAKAAALSEGPTIAALTAIAHSYTEPAYHAPFLVACADADLLRVEYEPVVASLRPLVLELLDELNTSRSTESGAEDTISASSATPLREKWESARRAVRRTQTSVREGRPVEDSDLNALREFSKHLRAEAERAGLTGSPSVALVEATRLAGTAVEVLATLRGPKEMAAAIDEVRELSRKASGDVAWRLARFLDLILDESPLSRITRANELRSQPEPPDRALLDAAIAGVLSIEPSVTTEPMTEEGPTISASGEDHFASGGVLEEEPEGLAVAPSGEQRVPESAQEAPHSNVGGEPPQPEEITKAPTTTETVATPVKQSEETPSRTVQTEELEHPEADHGEEISLASQVLADLVRALRFDLAYHIARAVGQDYRSAILAEAALAHAVRSPGSSAAAEMAAAATSLPLKRDDVGSVLLRLASVLRVALLDPASGAPAMLFAMSGTLESLPALRELAVAVAVPTNQMMSVAATGETLDAASAMAQAEAIASWARESRDRPTHRFRLHRSFELWQAWTAPSGPLGEILSMVGEDDPEAVGVVSQACQAFVTRDRVAAFIEQEDQRLREDRAGRAKPITGPARQELIRDVVEIIEQALAWCDSRSRATGSDRSSEQREQLVVRLGELKSRIDDELSTFNGDPWLTAAGDAARTSMMATIGLLFNQPLIGDELDAASALDRGIALVVEVPIDEEERPVREATLGELLAAAARSRDEGFEHRLASEQFGAAEMLLEEVVRPGDEFDVAAARVRLAAAERDAQVTVTQNYQALFERFAAARARGRIDEMSATVLYGQLLDAQPMGLDGVSRRDLGALRRELDEIATRLQAALDERREQVRNDVETAIGDERVSSEWAVRLQVLLERDELGAAEEYLHRAFAGETPPEERKDDADPLLMRRTITALGSGSLDGEIVEAVRHGSAARGLDFSLVPESQRETIAEALSAWIAMRTKEGRGSWKDHIRPVLRLLGILATNTEQPEALRVLAAPGRFFVDLIGEHSGTAFVPSFGSRAQGRRRLMFVFEPMPVGQLWDTAASSAMPDQPVYILHFGTMPLEERVSLARLARNRATGQVVVIDDAVLAACALSGRQAYDVTMRAVLPYAAANPYDPNLPGEIPEEMFYGRQSERDNIANLSGATFVSGGRRFGKTALLHSVRKIYERPQSNVLAVFVVIQHVAAGPQPSATDLWPLLARRLAEQGVVTASVAPNAEGVTSALRQWLSDNRDRRLLLLLDECDLFLRADSEVGFQNVAELRNLMIDFGGRFKVVFSGLQHVARYLKLPNQPLSQLPPPVVVGPLDPSAASDLVRRPLEALGYAPTSAQVDRLVTYCACNPSVIQLAGMQLVDHLRGEPIFGLAPWPIDDRLLDRLLESTELGDGVRDRLFWTLNLDHRYKLLAYLVAYRALTEGLATSASPTELRVQALEFWPDGFTSQRPDDVRALCDELVGLGVFAGDADNGYRMLSPAAVRLFGTDEAIELELMTAHETYVPDMAVGAAGSRLRLGSEHYSPLSAGQLADVIGQGRTQLRVVLGSRATCVTDVVTALRVAADLMLNVTVEEVSSRRDWRNKMTAPYEGHQVVVADATQISRESFEDSINAARRRGGTRSERGTRSGVLVVGPQDRETLRRLVAVVGERPPGDLADVTVELSRVDLDSLRAWARIEELDVVLPAQLARLLEVTGGWPILVERVLARVRGRGFDAAASEAEAWLSSNEGAHELVAAAGLDPDDPIQPPDAGVLGVFRALASLNLGGDPEDLASLLSGDSEIAEPDPAEALAILAALGALEVGDDGEVVVEPVLRRCFLAIDPRLAGS